MDDLFLLSEAQMRRIEPFFPLSHGIPRVDDRRVISGIVYGEIFYTLREVQIVVESWRRHYNAVRPHASLGYKPPAPEVFVRRSSRSSRTKDSVTASSC